MRSNAWIAVLAVGLACGGKATIDGPASGTGGASGVASTTSTASGITTTNAGVTVTTAGGGGAEPTCTGTGGAGECVTDGDILACWDCCTMLHGSGFMTVVANFSACGCDQQTCAGPCSQSLCGGLQQSPNPGCLNCAATALCPGPCQSYFDMLCSVDPDCMSFMACFASCAS